MRAHEPGELVDQTCPHDGAVRLVQERLHVTELTTGTLPLGSRGTRGYGEVTVTGLEVQWPDGDLGEAGKHTLSGGTGRELAQGLLEWLREVNKTIGPHDGADGAGSGWASYLDPVDEQEPVDGRDGSEQ